MNGDEDDRPGAGGEPIRELLSWWARGETSSREEIEQYATALRQFVREFRALQEAGRAALREARGHAANDNPFTC